MDERVMHDIATFLAAFSIGFFGSSHCIAMCGGIANALHMNVKPEGQITTPWLQCYYHVGRIFTYMIIGALAGLLGFMLIHLLGSRGQMALRIGAGLLLIAMGLYLGRWWLGVSYIERYGMKLWRRISRLLKYFLPPKTPLRAFILGSLWSWLPCGLVYSTLTWAISQGDWLKSMTLMACFGLGTVPALLTLGLFSQRLAHVFQSNITRQAAGILMIAFGFWTSAVVFIM